MRLATLPRVATLAAGAGVVSAARMPGFPREIAWALGVAGLLRLLLGGDGRSLLPRRVRVALVVTATALGLVLLFRSFSETSGAPLVALLALVAAYQAILLLARWTPFTGFLVLLLSSVHAAGVAFLAKDALSLGLTVAYVSLLVWGGVLLERYASGSRPTRSAGGAVLLRAPAGRGGDRAHLTTSVAVAICGVLLGGLCYAIAPRGEMRNTDPFRDRDRPSERDTAASSIVPDDGGATRTSGFVTGTGRGATGIRLGDVGRIKTDLTPFFAVEASGRPGSLGDLYLRGNTADTFVDGGWYPSAESARPVRYDDADDGVRDGWIPLAEDPASGAHDLRLTVLEGLASHGDGSSLLFLEPDPVRVRITRAGVPVSTFLSERADLKRYAANPFRAGDLVEERVVRTAPAEATLRAAASDRTSAPSPADLVVPPELEPLRDVALSVVGAERNPWRQAVLLEAWFRERFTYQLKLLDMGVPRNLAVLAFVTRVRKGHCEYFATAMALMLRTLGHPARVAFGFRGGDPLRETPGRWIVRGSNAHLWPEMYFRGIGWVGLEPTPPDREASDAKTVTRAADGTTSENGPGFAEHVLRYDAADRRALWAEAWHRVGSGLASIAEFLFGPSGYYVGWPALLLGAFLLVRRGARTRLVREAVGPGRRVPPGPYGEALLLLAKRGVRRRPAWTAGDLWRELRTRLPRSSRSFARLARAYERRRFGGGEDDPALRQEEADAVRELARTLDEAGESPGGG